MGWRNITNATNERTVIGGIYPKTGSGNSLPVWHPNYDLCAQVIAGIVGELSILSLDYTARQKVAGTNLNFFYAGQLPVHNPSQFNREELIFLVPRVLELTYTSHSMRPWAEDLGHIGAPFSFDPERRAYLRAELDAFFARKYGLSRDELRYLLDPADVKGDSYPSETFRGLRRNEIDRYREYRTQRRVLEAFDRLAMPQQNLPDSIITFPTPSLQPQPVPDMGSVADGSWSRPGTNPPGETMEILLAVLRTMPRSLPSERVRLTALLAIEPHYLAKHLVKHLEADQFVQWRRVVGPDAEKPAPDSDQLDKHWGATVRHFRTHNWMEEQGCNWGPGTLPDHIPGEWAVGRAAIAWDAMRHIGESAEVIQSFAPFLTRRRNAEAA